MVLINLILLGDIIRKDRIGGVFVQNVSSSCHCFPIIGSNFPLTTRPWGTMDHCSFLDVRAQVSIHLKRKKHKLWSPKNELKAIRKYGGTDVPKDNEHEMSNVMSFARQDALTVLKKLIIAYNQERGRVIIFCKGHTNYLWTNSVPVMVVWY